jgi:hypothetical protein
MANYFTNFSLILKLPDEAAQKRALELAAQARDLMYESAKPPAEFPAALAEVIDDWQFETEAENLPDGWGLWLHSDCGGIDAVCTFIQHLLQTFDPGGRVTFEWSHDCSKPRVDAYGGGAAIITANEIKTMNTGQWLHENAA